MDSHEYNLLAALLRELKEDMRQDTAKLEEAMLRMEVKFGAHAELDVERFTEIRDILMSWKGAATMAMIFIPAIVSLVVGLLVKYF